MVLPFFRVGKVSIETLRKCTCTNVDMRIRSLELSLKNDEETMDLSAF